MDVAADVVLLITVLSVFMVGVMGGESCGPEVETTPFDEPVLRLFKSELVCVLPGTCERKNSFHSLGTF